MVLAQPHSGSLEHPWPGVGTGKLGPVGGGQEMALVQKEREVPQGVRLACP